jgi:hypothetical protein
MDFKYIPFQVPNDWYKELFINLIKKIGKEMKFNIRYEEKTFIVIEIPEVRKDIFKIFKRLHKVNNLFSDDGENGRVRITELGLAALDEQKQDEVIQLGK